MYPLMQILSILVIVFSTVTNSLISRQPLLLIVLDGFRYDYLELLPLPSGLDQLKSTGTFARRLTPVFPSLTFPNLNSLVTGVYPENHGFVANVMYDPIHETTFYSPDEGHGNEEYWWNVSTPIWASSKANQINTGMFNWPTCDVKIRDQLPNFCSNHVQFQELTIVAKHLSDILQRFANEDLEFAMLYVEHIDSVGHAYGPESEEMKKAVANVDKLFVDLLDNLKNYDNLKVNIIVASDHGMLDIGSNGSTHLSLTDYVTIDDIEMITGDGAVVGIYPKVARFDKVYNELKAMNNVEVWKKENIPEVYHLKYSERTAPILLIANKDYVILPVTDSNKQNPQMTGHYQYQTIKKGVHGYDPIKVPEMNGLLILNGPAFDKTKSVEEINIVDLYNMLTVLLNINGQPNNGSWKNICPLLANNYKEKCQLQAKSKNNANINSLNSILLIPIYILFFSFYT